MHSNTSGQLCLQKSVCLSENSVKPCLFELVNTLFNRKQLLINLFFQIVKQGDSKLTTEQVSTQRGEKKLCKD